MTKKKNSQFSYIKDDQERNDFIKLHDTMVNSDILLKDLSDLFESHCQISQV